MRSIAEIESEIGRVKEELAHVQGSKTEVYARIVGYYRSVRNWNKGKREEYNHRTLFAENESRIAEHLASGTGCNFVSESGKDTIIGFNEESMADSLVTSYELYTRKTCPNCPPVKEICTNLPLSGIQHDVDTPTGLARAQNCGVVSAPTVIFYNENGTEIHRACTVKQIRALPSLVQVQEAAPALF